MHPNEELIHRFYAAFQKRDAATMASCYHPDVRFSDPVYTDLRGWRAGAMWRFLCERAASSGLRIEYRDVSADDRAGRAHWDAYYRFGTGRDVHNSIDAEFEFKDGKIVRHRDRFDFWRWTRMALGPVGVLLGWTPLIQNGVRKKAGGLFEAWIAKNGVAPTAAR
ncbi:MAG TPA: nuclear transport factor 2 family protein [Planctomycetota bacterium]|nr:nuclear transport factor 2 family protein [Planctomycetota bacterium]